MMGRHPRGSSLIELLVALFVGTLVSGGAFLCVYQFQKTADLLTSLLDRDRSLVVAPLLLERWVASAGCHLDPVEPGIEISDSLLQARADFDGPGSLPDGLLDSPFESVAIRSARDSLQLRSGAGNFQPVLDSVKAARFSLETKALVRVDLTLASSPSRLGHASPTLDRPLLIHLWNRRLQLFRE